MDATEWTTALILRLKAAAPLPDDCWGNFSIMADGRSTFVRLSDNVECQKVFEPHAWAQVFVRTNPNASTPWIAVVGNEAYVLDLLRFLDSSKKSLLEVRAAKKKPRRRRRSA